MKIVILDRVAIGYDTPVDRLSSLGNLCIYDSTSDNEIQERICDADILIVNKVKISCKDLKEAKKLKLICVFATGYDNIDLNAARKHKIAVCNVPAYSTDSVALFTVANVLSLITHQREYNRYVVNGEYSNSGFPNKLSPVYHELRGKIWGIIGLGNIGKAVANVATAFGADVIVYKRNPVKGYKCVDIDTLCKNSDIITVHCPLNSDSRDLINAEKISHMKPSVVVVNAARGAVINEEDVAQAIESGRIGAFGSDVYTTEPFPSHHPFNRIKCFDNVLLTPHAAWGAYEARVRCMNITCDNISAFISGGNHNRVD